MNWLGTGLCLSGCPKHKVVWTLVMYLMVPSSLSFAAFLFLLIIRLSLENSLKHVVVLLHWALNCYVAFVQLS